MEVVSLVTLKLSNLIIISVINQANCTLLHVLILLSNIAELFLVQALDCTHVGQSTNNGTARHASVLAEGNHDADYARTDAADKGEENKKKVTVGEADHHQNPK